MYFRITLVIMFMSGDTFPRSWMTTSVNPVSLSSPAVFLFTRIKVQNGTWQKYVVNCVLSNCSEI